MSSNSGVNMAGHNPGERHLISSRHLLMHPPVASKSSAEASADAPAARTKIDTFLLDPWLNAD
jgi:hypothetical protein